MMHSFSHPHAKKQKKNHRETKETNNSFYLPEEISTNILKRLPVKSLIRFQSVCKLWKSLIKSETFVHENLHYYSIHNPCILLADPYPLNSVKLYLLNNDMKVVPLNCKTMFYVLRDSEIIGSSNGLICLSTYNPSRVFAFWNPSTGQLRYGPKLPNGCVFRSGFGFSPILNDYIILSFNYHAGMQNIQGQVYSLKTGLWKKLESSCLEGLNIFNECFDVNGSIFWVGSKYDFYLDIKEHFMLQYDMVLEVFTLIQTPITDQGLSSPIISIAIHENKLALLSRSSIRKYDSFVIEMWIMEDPVGKSGERFGWTKKFSICHPSLLYPLTIWRNKIFYIPRCTRATEDKKLSDERKSIGLVDLTTCEVDIFDIGIYVDAKIPFINHLESLLPVVNNHIVEL